MQIQTPFSEDFKLSGLEILCCSLIALHLALLYKITAQVDELFVMGLFWYIFFQKFRLDHSQNENSSGWLSSVVGYLLIACLLTRCLSYFWFDPTFLNAIPLLIVLSVGLLSLGPSTLKYRVELAFCFLILLPSDWITNWLNQGPGMPLQIITARISSFFLHYLGYAVQTQGSIIKLPQGTVNVELGCTSFSVIFSLAQIWCLLLLMFPLSRKAQMWIIAGMFVITHIVTFIRVALLAYVVDQPDLFNYWHDDQGQQIISTLLILLLGGSYYLFHVREQDAIVEAV